MVDGVTDGRAVDVYTQLRELLEILGGEIVSMVLRADGGDMLLKFGIFRCQDLETTFIAINKKTKRSEYVSQAERVNCADIVIRVVPRLNVMAKPGLDFLNGGVGVRDACNSPGGTCGLRRRPATVLKR